MIRGMGFGNTTTIYVASGKIYNAQKYMAPLRQLFPLLETKETLASADELAPFKVFFLFRNFKKNSQIQKQQLYLSYFCCIIHISSMTLQYFLGH